MLATFAGYPRNPAAAVDIRNILHIRKDETQSLQCPQGFSSVSIEFYAKVDIYKIKHDSFQEDIYCKLAKKIANKVPYNLVASEASERFS